jgi:hypothetical protein
METLENVKNEQATSPLEVAELEGLTKEQLIQLANDKFGLNIAITMNKEQIHALIMKFHQGQVAQSQKESIESAKLVVAEDDPMITATFTNIESPSVDIEFPYDSGKGIKKGGKVPRYHFYDGVSYSMPFSVYQHLIALVVPDNKYEVDQYGFVKGVKAGVRKRFALELQITKEQMISMSKGK